MKAFLFLSFVAFVACAPQYNYQQQQGLGPVAQQQQQQLAPIQNYAPAPAPAAAQNYAPVQQQNVQPEPQISVSKVFYIHSAPEESAEEAQAQQLGGGPSRKDYRIVFIKAPSQSNAAAALSLAQSQNEEKTVIYVLTKNPDIGELQAQLSEAKGPASKPEVFFIKYKTQEEAQHAQQQIQAQYDALGGTSQTSDEGVAPVQSFIGALGNNAGPASENTGAIENSGVGVAPGPVAGPPAGVPSIRGGAANQAYLPPRYY